MKRYKTLKYFRLLPGNKIRISKSKFLASRHLFEEREDGSFEIVKFPVGFFPGDVFEVPEMLPGMARRVQETDEELRAPGCEPTKPGQLLPQLKSAETKDEDPPEDEGEEPTIEEILNAIRSLDQDDDDLVGVYLLSPQPMTKPGQRVAFLRLRPLRPSWVAISTRRTGTRPWKLRRKPARI